MNRYLGAEGICFTNDLSVTIRAIKATQKATKKAMADAAAGEVKWFPKEEVIAAIIGTPIPAMSIIMANDIISPFPFMINFFFIKYA